MSIVIAGLLLVIVVQLAIIIYVLHGGGGLPWMVQAEDGLLSGKIAAPPHHRTLAAKLEYLMCSRRFELELAEQRFRREQGLAQPTSDELDFGASPADVES